MNKDRTIVTLILVTVGIGFFIFTMFSKVGTLLMTPIMTTTEYLNQWPVFTYGNLIIQQPSSSIIILVLSIVTVSLGFHYLKLKDNHFSFWLGVNFILWGIGAFLAGLSYQAFGYYLKCSGLTACLVTDWVELLYMTLTVLSINAILMAYAAIIQPYQSALALRRFAFISIFTYLVYQGIGMMIPDRFMLSYESLLLFLSPNLVIFILLSYRNRHEEGHAQLLKLWIAFIFVNLAYFVALLSGQGSFILAKTGFWFNENDTLHVLLIAWMIGWWILIPAKEFNHEPHITKNKASL